MKQTLLTVLLSALLMFAPAYAEQIPVVSPSGAKTTVAVTDTAGLFMIATWCPYSQSFVRVLQDPKIKPYLKGKQLAFVVMNEWPLLEKKLAKKGRSNELPGMKKRSGHAYVYDPSLLRRLPGRYYYLTDAALLDTVQSFPSAYAEGGFYAEVEDWLETHTGLPKALFNQKLEQYMPE